MSDNQPTPPHLSRPEQDRLPYIPGLDGLRALAVIAVLLYHAGLPIFGGFLGVESFFVVSGFLITALLLVEWGHHGRIDLPAFWLRRARRLLPALFFMLAGTLIFASLGPRGVSASLRDDTLAALAYVMNWRLIWSGQPYFDPLVRPPLLQHLWSLAVEEQFYLLWPALFVAGMRWLRRGGLLVMTLAAVVGSTLLMAWLDRSGADVSRIYYGTDTRAAGVLLGAALALVWTPGRVPAAASRRLGTLLDGAGTLALAGLIAGFISVSNQHPLLYRGGFALIATATALVIAALTHPQARLLPRLLAWSPLPAIGLRSYGLYLWHWPVFMVTRPYIDVPLDGPPLLALRLAIVAALVELSYRYVELPARRGAIERAWRRFWGAGGVPRPALPGGARGRTLAIRWICFLVPSLLLIAVGSRAAKSNASRIADPAAALTLSAGLPVVATATAPRPTASPTAQAPAVAAAPSATAVAPTPTVSEDGSTRSTRVELPPAPPEATPAPTVAAPLDPALIAELQRLLDDTVADGYIPGAVLSVSIPGNQPWSGASGVADFQTGAPMEPETLVHLASITKMFTAVVVLQLAEEGKLDLDAPIGTYLPEIVLFADTMTARHLLNQTTGVYDYLEDPQFFVEAYRDPEHTWTPDELVAMADQIGPAFRPGAEWRYSSTNYVILGMLVEQVTGRTLAQEMRQRIFDPLQLTRTFFAPDEPLQGNLAQGHIEDSDRADVSMTFVFGTGNLVSTADDLRRFTDALFEGRLLQPESLAMMTAMVETGGAYDMPELEYGLGLMGARLNVGPAADGTERPEAARAVLGHIGGIAGFRSAVWRTRDSDITISLSVNQAAIDPNLLARDVLDAILLWQGR